MIQNKQDFIPGNKYKAKNNCYCEHYLHEVSSYYREGIKEKKLSEGQVVTFKEDFQNMLGKFARVVDENGVEYDIKHKYLEPAWVPACG